MDNGRARQLASQNPSPQTPHLKCVHCRELPNKQQKKRLRRDAKRAIGAKLGHAPIDGKTTVERSSKRATQSHAKVICLPDDDNQVP